jgi:ribosomal protein S18 acetylase RimI-like enzyme
MKIKVERLKTSDWESFFALFRKIVNGFDSYPQKARDFFTKEERVKRAFLKKKRIFWVAKKEKEIVGFLIAIIEDEEIVFINWMGVKKGFQGQGIGKKLVLNWENWAKKEGYKKLRVSTTVKENISFYEKLGFCFKRKIEKNYYDLNRYVLEKKI